MIIIESFNHFVGQFDGSPIEADLQFILFLLLKLSQISRQSDNLELV